MLRTLTLAIFYHKISLLYRGILFVSINSGIRLEDAMKKLMKKLEDIMVAITFAEAGEFDEANKQAGAGHNEDSEASDRIQQPLKGKIAVEGACK